MFFAEKPKRPFASRCSVVRSNSAGDIDVDGFDSSVTVPLLPRHAATMESAAAFDHSLESRWCGSSSVRLNFGSNQRPG